MSCRFWKTLQNLTTSPKTVRTRDFRPKQVQIWSDLPWHHPATWKQLRPWHQIYPHKRSYIIKYKRKHFLMFYFCSKNKTLCVFVSHPNSNLVNLNRPRTEAEKKSSLEFTICLHEIVFKSFWITRARLILNVYLTSGLLDFSNHRLAVECAAVA